MNKLVKKILIGFLIALLGSTGVFLIISSKELPHTTEETDCFDREYNKINDVTCEQVVYDSKFLYWVGIISGFLLITGAACIFMLYVAWVITEELMIK